MPTSRCVGHQPTRAFDLAVGVGGLKVQDLGFGVRDPVFVIRNPPQNPRLRKNMAPTMLWHHIRHWEHPSFEPASFHSLSGYFADV